MFDDYCIVGNAPCEQGSGNGELIDSYGQVFRFNNFTTEGYEDDYGTKITHWVTTFAKDIKFCREGKYENVLCPLPLNIPQHLKRYSYTNPWYLENYNNVNFIPVEIFHDLKIHLDNPSTGIALLYWIYRETGSLDDDRVFGFTFFDKTQDHHYFDKQDACLHSGDKEKDLYFKMIKGEL